MSHLDTANISAEHAADGCSVHLNAPVNEQSALALEGALKEAFTYYQYNCLTLRITSDGGLLPALLHMFGAMERWQAKGKIVQTEAVFRASSAAALLLARGTIGSRSMSLHTALLFHHTRAVGGGTGAITADAAGKMASALFTEDKRLLGGLVDHVEAGFGGAASMAQEGMARCELVRDGLSKVASTMSSQQTLKGAKWLAAVSKCFAASLAVGHTRPYVEMLVRRFGDDNGMSAQEAYALLLVDRVNDLPSLVPKAAMACSKRSGLNCAMVAA
jgi:ATP-dependent protease ClpP protease subunit